MRYLLGACFVAHPMAGSGIQKVNENMVQTLRVLRWERRGRPVSKCSESKNKMYKVPCTHPSLTHNPVHRPGEVLTIIYFMPSPQKYTLDHVMRSEDPL